MNLWPSVRPKYTLEGPILKIQKETTVYALYCIPNAGLDTFSCVSLVWSLLNTSRPWIWLDFMLSKSPYAINSVFKNHIAFLYWVPLCFSKKIRLQIRDLRLGIQLIERTFVLITSFPPFYDGWPTFTPPVASLSFSLQSWWQEDFCSAWHSPKHIPMWEIAWETSLHEKVRDCFRLDRFMPKNQE